MNPEPQRTMLAQDLQVLSKELLRGRQGPPPAIQDARALKP